MTHELYKRYRPKTLKTVVGQKSTCDSLARMIKTQKIPHAIMFTGPSGTGKTTLARILKKALCCGESDYVEINAADTRGVDIVREIRQRMGLAPMNGKSRIYLIDEAQGLTTAAQEAFLKILEDTPKHVYFIFCSTDPAKIKRTIHTRMTCFALKPITAKDMATLINYVTEAESVDQLNEDLIDAIVVEAKGSPRQALVILEKVLSVDDEDDRLSAVKSVEAEAQAIEICRALLAPGNQWVKVKKLLKTVDEDPETIRWMVLGYMTGVLLGDSKNMIKRAAAVIATFRDNFYDSKKAGLALACYEVFHQ